MAGSLTQKETSMLQDQLRHEGVCIRKYKGYAARTTDATLRGMFYEFAQDEQDHFNTINGLLGGAQSGQGGVQAQSPNQGQNQALSQGPKLSQPSQSPTVRQPMNTEEFIERAAEERLQSGVFGQHRKPKSQEQPEPYQAESQQPQVQPSQPPQAQSHWPLTQPGQPGQQQSGQQGESETSSELIPMFRTETAEEFAGGTGLGESDSSVVTDMLMTEQFVSNSYDTAIFDTTNQQVRQALQHIQKDEQKHGQGLRDYMQRRGLSGGQR